MDGQPQRTGDRQPKEGAQQLGARRVVGSPRDQRRCGKGQAKADERGEQLRASSIEREPEHRQQHERSEDRRIGARGVTQEGDDREVQKRWRRLRPCRKPPPGDEVDRSGQRQRQQRGGEDLVRAGARPKRDHPRKCREGDGGERRQSPTQSSVLERPLSRLSPRQVLARARSPSLVRLHP